MLDFDLYIPTRIVFGKGAHREAGELLKPYCRKLLLHYGGGSIKKSGLYDEVVSSLKKSGLDFVELGGVVPNPRLSLVHEGIALCKKEGVDLILAVGGGSTIDSSKAIALGFYYDGDVWDIYEQGKPVSKALPIASILTIPAAGSESSKSTVITNEAKRMKLGYNNDIVRPVLSIMNPALFSTLPKNQIANGIADMMSHIMERYFTNTTHTALTDGLCESALKTIMKFAPRVYKDPSDYDSWCEIGFAGALAHNNLLGVGREQDWACHNMEHELSALFDVAHGAGLSALTASWMRYVYKANIPMFMQFAVNVMGVEGSFRESDDLIHEAINRLENFFKSLGLPVTLGELGIEEKDFDLMAKKATGIAYGKEHTIGNLQKLSFQDVIEIFKMAK